MTSMDKTAIVFSIAITVIGVGIAASSSSGGFDSAPTSPTDPPDPTMDTKVTIEKEMEEMVTIEKEMEEMVTIEKETELQKHIVNIPAGTSVIGCEQTNVCYLPAEITINAGDTVKWFNLDTVLHTVSGGSPAGLSGVFDSNLIMIDATYEFTFDEVGSFDYFCKMHPWMTGIVTVN